MAYEPMVLLLAVAYFLATGSFDVEAIIHVPAPIIGSTVGVFIGMLFILTIKLRKSPFDLSYSHHAHQDLVKGVTTEMSGRVLGMVDIMHWCENVLFVDCLILCMEQPHLHIRRDRSVSVGLFPGNLDRQQLCTSQMAADA